MPRAARRASASDTYHVVIRGIGRQIIFEDDVDRAQFMCKLADYLEECRGTIYAWCLMENHVHLLLRMPLDKLTLLMRKLCTSYSRYFNGRHERVGHLFQNRFYSAPVESDEYLLTVLRYIHQNPQSANMAPLQNYPWSSYDEYLNGARIATTDLPMSLLGGVEQFVEFHSSAQPVDGTLEGDCQLTDDETLRLAKSLYGDDYIASINAMSKPLRDEALGKLHLAGATAKQIERLTGIGRGIVSRACRDAKSHVC